MPKTTINDIITFLEQTPDDSWCGYTQDDRQGHHCVLGHLYLKPKSGIHDLFDLDALGLNAGVLAAVNNHGDETKGWWEGEDALNPTPSLIIKTRVLNYLRSRV